MCKGCLRCRLGWDSASLAIIPRRRNETRESVDAVGQHIHRREAGKETQQPRMVRVALLWFIPRMGVEAEEELNVLEGGQTRVTVRLGHGNNTYTHRIGQGAVHISQKEVSELDGV